MLAPKSVLDLLAAPAGTRATITFDDVTASEAALLVESLTCIRKAEEQGDDYACGVQPREPDTIEVPTPSPDDRHGDVCFVAEYDGGVEHYELGWGHCMGGRASCSSDNNWSAWGFGLYAGGDLHDGFGSVQEILDAFDDVFLSLEDYRAGHSVKIEQVVNAARAWAKLKPVEECTQAELEGDPQEDR